MRVYGIITADVVGSRKVESFRKLRDAKLRALAKYHARNGLLLSEYAVTAWDEFQVILQKPEFLPIVIFDLHRFFHPMQLRVAAGIGTVTGAHRKPVNQYAGGEAFERARQASDFLKSGATRFPLRTRWDTGDELLDSTANAMYGLYDTLLQQVTTKQWKTINAYEESGKQEVVARKLGLTISTVSRNLKRGYYWQLIVVRDAMRRLFREKLELHENVQLR